MRKLLVTSFLALCLSSSFVMHAQAAAAASSSSAEEEAPQAKRARMTQVYGIPTYDALFKYVLSQDSIRPSFFNAFVPGLTITSSQRLDEHMNPLQELQLLRDFIHRRDTGDVVSRLSSSPGVCLCAPHPTTADLVKDDGATTFLHEMIGHFEDIKKAFPKARYDGTMDFVCALNTGDYALIEMQVIPQDYWDRRALAYAAAFYGNQLRRGDHWKQIKRVIGLNILGGGKDEKVHWSDTPGQYVRHYKFQEQLHEAPAKRYIDGIELIQYSIMNAPDTASSAEREKQDWLTFFKRGYRMTEDQVREQIQTPAVLAAFERAKLSTLPGDVKEAYEAEDKEYDRFSQHTAAEVAKGEAKGLREGLLIGARALKALGTMTDAQIVAQLGGALTEAEVADIKI